MYSRLLYQLDTSWLTINDRTPINRSDKAAAVLELAQTLVN